MKILTQLKAIFSAAKCVSCAACAGYSMRLAALLSRGPLLRAGLASPAPAPASTAALPRDTPFLSFYERTTGEHIDDAKLQTIRKKHPKLERLSADQISTILLVLEKFGITSAEACSRPHLFQMRPITMDNYGEVLRECGFISIKPNYLLRYHTLARIRTIAQLKKGGYILKDVNVDERLLQQFEIWPPTHRITDRCSEEYTILQVRLKIMSKYLSWRLDVSDAEFQKYCHNYLVMKHRPMSVIQEAINIAQNDIKFDANTIRRHGFLISADPVNTRLILDNVPELAGVDIRQVIRIVPAIVKNNYNALLKIRNIMQNYSISDDAQKRCLRVYCMKPETVEERLAELSTVKEFQVLSSTPRALLMVLHQKKMLHRLSRLRAANKQCYSLTKFVSASKVFNAQLTDFGDRTCSRDVASVVISSLNIDLEKHMDPSLSIKNKPARERARREGITKIAKPIATSYTKLAIFILQKHPYWRNVSPNIVDSNIKILKVRFTDDAIFTNCHLLLYPTSEIQQHLEDILAMKTSCKESKAKHADPSFSNLNYTLLDEYAVLSLILYAIEKKFHFTGNGIWYNSNDKR